MFRQFHVNGDRTSHNASPQKTLLRGSTERERERERATEKARRAFVSFGRMVTAVLLLLLLAGLGQFLSLDTGNCCCCCLSCCC